MSKSYKKINDWDEENIPNKKPVIKEKRKKKNLKREWETYGSEAEDHEDFYGR